MSKERPILFSAPMVRAILEGRKTETRRVVKFISTADLETFLNNVPNKTACCPYGKPGDRLWVREAWRTYQSLDSLNPSRIDAGVGIQYAALGTNIHGDRGDYLLGMGRLRPSIFMPRWASRILLEITAVRVERLQDIGYEDALAEGVQDMTALLHDEWKPLEGESGNDCARRLRWPQRLYEQLWESINGPGSWDANPWVWVIEFKVVTA